MLRRILVPMLLGVALAAAVDAGNADAGVFHRMVSRRPASIKPGQQRLYKHYATRTRGSLPRWTWDVPLDVRVWKWPPYYRR